MSRSTVQLYSFLVYTRLQAFTCVRRCSADILVVVNFLFAQCCLHVV